MSAKWASGPWISEEKQINLKAYRDFVGEVTSDTSDNLEAMIFRLQELFYHVWQLIVFLTICICICLIKSDIRKIPLSLKNVSHNSSSVSISTPQDITYIDLFWFLLLCM